MRHDLEGDRMHLIVDFHSPNIHLMTNRREMTAFLNELVEIAEMHTVGNPIVVGFPWPSSEDSDALSGVCFLKESAIVVHTYPEKKFVFLDIFSCKDFKADELTGHIVRTFQAEGPTILLLDRGIDMRTGTIIPARLRGD